jgi:hypothetical protein
MQLLYILNESRICEKMGDMSIFSSLDKLLLAVEAIDVINQEYHAFLSDGRRINLSAHSRYSTVVATIETKNNSTHILVSLVKQFLSNIPTCRVQLEINRTDSNIDDLGYLLTLVPSNLID